MVAVATTSSGIAEAIIDVERPSTDIDAQKATTTTSGSQSVMSATTMEEEIYEDDSNDNDSNSNSNSNSDDSSGQEADVYNMRTDATLLIDHQDLLK